MFSLEAAKNWVITTMVPVASGIAATWATVHLHFLATFHITSGSVAGAVAQALVFGVTALVSFLGVHFHLKAVGKHG